MLLDALGMFFRIKLSSWAPGAAKASDVQLLLDLKMAIENLIHDVSSPLSDHAEARKRSRSAAVGVSFIIPARASVVASRNSELLKKLAT